MKLAAPMVALLALLAIVVFPDAVASGPVVADAAREARGDGTVVPSQYIVTYNRSAEAPEEETRVRERRENFAAEHVYRRAVEGFAAELTPRQVERLEADPEVAEITPDRKVSALAELASGEPQPPAGVRRIGAANSTSVREPSRANVAVIDTGIELDHPDLDAANGKDCVTPGTPAVDDNGHGTHVAGTVAAKNDGSGVSGVTPGTKVFSVKVLNLAGSGMMSQVICGIDWVTATRTDSDPSNDIAVANMSLGGLGPPVRSCGDTMDPQHKAICASIAAGVTYVVAAGNDGWEFDNPTAPEVPAAYPEVLTVSAMGDTDGRPGGSGATPLCRSGEADDRFASFSNYAATAAGRAHAITAPGVCVRSTYPGKSYSTMSGTSMATPHVAGAVALCLDEGGEPGPCAGLSPPQIGARMRDEAAARARADAGFGFEGDPDHPVPRGFFGHLTWAAAGDSRAPTIVSTSPRDGQTAVGRTAEIRVTFSEPMDEAATEAAFSVTRSTDGARVPGTLSWRGETMVFRPSTSLGAGTWYTVRLASGARDLAGNLLVADERSWSFRTLARITVAPSAAVLETGTLRGGGHRQLRTDNDRYFAVNSTTRATRSTSWFGRFAGISNALRSLRVVSRTKSSAECRQRVALYRWTTRSWVAVDERAVGRNEVGIAGSASGKLADYVSGPSGNGEVRVRVRCTRTASTFHASADKLGIDYERP